MAVGASQPLLKLQSQQHRLTLGTGGNANFSDNEGVESL